MILWISPWWMRDEWEICRHLSSIARLLLTEEDQNHLWDGLKDERDRSKSVSKQSRLTQVPFQELRGRFMGVRHAHRWREHTYHRYVHQPRGGWPLKANHFELGRPATPTRKIGGVPGFDRVVNIVQFSVMGPDVKRLHVAAVARLSYHLWTTLQFCSPS